MKDNIGFYIEFIAEVEKNPTLYNHGLVDYNNKRTTEIIWTKIGKKFNERGEDCKSKWKSIRSAYIRSLNTKSKRPSKDYYLAPYLLFLNPFAKSRPQEDNISITQEDERNTVDPEHESQIEETSNDVPDLTFADEDPLRHEAPVASFSASGPHFSNCSIQPSKSRNHMSEIEKCAIDYFTLKKKKLENMHQPETRQKDPCEMFLLSLVPHMSSMSQQQQLGFQRGVLELIEHIKYPSARRA